MLIIVESPAKAKTIGKIVGNRHLVKASVGHIRRISDSKKTAEGKALEINGIDIEHNFQPLFEVDPAKNDVVKDLLKLAKAAKEGILFATDSDREGEAISWHLAEILKVPVEKVQRLEFHEITKKAIDEAMKNPRELNLQLVNAQQARQVLDKLVGYKLSPVLWNVMGNFHLSAGRVQSPALRLVCEREIEIQNFVPQEYWEIFGFFQSDKNKQKDLTNIWQSPETEKSEKIDTESWLKFSLSKGNKLPKIIESKDKSLELTSGLEQNRLFTVINVKHSNETTRTKPPFTTSTLQQAASSRLGMSPKITMQLAQKLYEGVDIDGEPTAIITYMRTDSCNLSTESIDAARNWIKKNHNDFLPEKPKFYKSKTRNAQEAHEAIRPINVLLAPAQLKGKLEARMWKLYELIWKQTVACQMTDEIRERVSFELENETKDQFSGSVAWTIHAGFKILFEAQESLQKPDLKFEIGEKFDLQKILFDQHFTQPPSRYSAASLIKKLEDLGIGRPSTYASIISTLHDREYVETTGSSIAPTNLGMKVSQLLVDNFTQVTGSEMTATMEDNLDAISRGEKQYQEVLNDFWWNFKKEVENKSSGLVEQKMQYRTTATDDKCPVCGGNMDLKLGRFGDYFQCQNEKTHQFAKNFREHAVAVEKAKQYENQLQGRKCAVCEKDLIIRVSKASLKPYIACPDYKVGNDHTITDIVFGECPKCQKDGRTGEKQGKLVFKTSKKVQGVFIGCSLAPRVCGYIQKEGEQKI